MLLGHQWQFGDYSCVNISDNDVYMERYAGNTTVQVPIWKRVLHFKSIQPSLAGMYICAANYDKTLFNQSVEIQVTSE